jgi:hypothetical protein
MEINESSWCRTHRKAITIQGSSSVEVQASSPISRLWKPANRFPFSSSCLKSLFVAHTILRLQPIGSKVLLVVYWKKWRKITAFYHEPQGVDCLWVCDNDEQILGLTLRYPAVFEPEPHPLFSIASNEGTLCCYAFLATSFCPVAYLVTCLSCGQSYVAKVEPIYKHETCPQGGLISGHRLNLL